MLNTQYQPRNSPWLRSRSLWAAQVSPIVNTHTIGENSCKAENTVGGRNEHLPSVTPWRRQTLLPSGHTIANDDSKWSTTYLQIPGGHNQTIPNSPSDCLPKTSRGASYPNTSNCHDATEPSQFTGSGWSETQAARVQPTDSSINQLLSTQMNRLDISEQGRGLDTHFSNHRDRMNFHYQPDHRDSFELVKACSSAHDFGQIPPGFNDLYGLTQISRLQPPVAISPRTVGGHEIVSDRATYGFIGQQSRSRTPQSSQRSATSANFDAMTTHDSSSRSSGSHQSTQLHDDARCDKGERYAADSFADDYFRRIAYGQDDGFRAFQEANLLDSYRQADGRSNTANMHELRPQNSHRLDPSIPPSFYETTPRYDQNISQATYSAVDQRLVRHDHSQILTPDVPNFREHTMIQSHPPYGALMGMNNGPWPWAFQNQNSQGMVLPNTHTQRQMFELDPTHGVRSKLLHDFKQMPQVGIRWELRDIHDHVVEFAGDQAGSKFIQTHLETASSEEKARIFQEILPNSWQLMNDVFGNYVMQKYFKFGDQCQKMILVRQMKGKVLSLAKHTYGCRVLQKALKYSLHQERIALISELSSHTLLLIRDQNGNHVVQKIIKHVQCMHIPAITRICIDKLQELSVDVYGCRIVQRLLDHYEGPLRNSIFEQLHRSSRNLITDQYGNYVMQWIIRKGSPEDRQKVMSVILGSLVSFTRQKFASNVVEKCIEHGTAEQKRQIMFELCSGEGSLASDTPNQLPGQRPVTLDNLIRDSYGNYVIQKLLDSIDNVKDYANFVSRLDPAIAKIQRTAPCKQADNVHKKMLRIEWPHVNGNSRVPSEPRLRKVPEEQHNTDRMSFKDFHGKIGNPKVVTSPSSDSSDEARMPKEVRLGSRQSFL